ncbi:MAG: maltose alpha-D-glucosyltransferase [Actinobacteria bacterium]|nr:maltose alpha-D-glucosyltransferase [Actinomycetota bacterium]
MTDPGATADDHQWYRDAVIYELHVRAFRDANGDGIGDFKGLTEKLDYLQDLGVTAIWLLPFYPSPLRDDGYDIADYNAIHPDYGTMRQFRRFVEEAHERDLKVITELVINHTSDQHPWFQRAVKAPKGSRYRDWYVWSDDPDQWDEVRIIFQDFEPSNWTWHPEAEQYYWHRFFHHQPDLNFDNEEVQDAVKKALDHWAEIGVDGFRLDAIPYLYERDGTNGENLPETHDYLKSLRAHLDETWPGRMFLAEANQWPEDAAEYFGDDDECHMNFHFPLMPRLFMAVSQEDRFPIIDILQQTPAIGGASQWALFLRNHDELTLEMVTDEERDFMYRAYAHDQRMRINLGIRRRLAPLLGNDRRQIELMNSLLFSMPGTPVLYYGDEIGMGDNIYLGDRNGVRTPMQWSPDRNAGFSSTNPQRLYLPVVIDPEYHFETVNVESQQNNPRSLLWWMKRLIALRKRNSVFGRGTIEFLYPDNPKVLAFVRTLEHEDRDDEHVLVVANLSRHAQPCELDLGQFEGMTLVEMLGHTAFPAVTETPYSLTLGPFQFYWFSVERAPSRLSMSKMPQLANEGGIPGELDAPEVTVSGDWRALLKGRGKERLEGVMPALLERQRWFGGKARAVRGCEIVDVIPLGDRAEAEVQVLIVRVDYIDGEPEEYVVPVAFAEGEEAGRIEVTAPRSVLATVRGRGQAGHSGLLYDALQTEDAASLLLDAVVHDRSFESAGGELVGRPLAALDATVTELSPQPLRAEQSNTSIRFGDQLLLKVVRKLEPGTSPDVEIGRALSGRFEHTPDLVGTVDHVREKGPDRTVAVLHRYVANEGDAWTFTLDELGRFCERMLTEPPARGRVVPSELPSSLALAADEIPDTVHDVVGPYLDAAILLGRRTGEMHVAIASIGDDRAFAPEGFTSLYQRSLYQSIRNALRKGLQAAKKASRHLDDTDLQTRILMLADRESEVLERLTSLSETRIDAVRTRIHGDYHLGQVLWTGRDFVLIDFEGEPARPLGERRLKRSPLRDVAGMLRSFHYATSSALVDQAERGAVTPGTVAHDELADWLTYWNHWVGASFLRGYLDATADADLVPGDPEHVRILLDAFLLEKAIYELGYELNNRPQWVDIPLAGIAEVLQGSDA